MLAAEIVALGVEMAWEKFISLARIEAHRGECVLPTYHARLIMERLAEEGFTVRVDGNWATVRWGLH